MSAQASDACAPMLVIAMTVVNRTIHGPPPLHRSTLNGRTIYELLSWQKLLLLALTWWLAIFFAARDGFTNDWHLNCVFVSLLVAVRLGIANTEIFMA